MNVLEIYQFKQVGWLLDQCLILKYDILGYKLFLSKIRFELFSFKIKNFKMLLYRVFCLIEVNLGLFIFFVNFF